MSSFPFRAVCAKQDYMASNTEHTHETLSQRIRELAEQVECIDAAYLFGVAATNGGGIPSLRELDVGVLCHPHRPHGDSVAGLQTALNESLGVDELDVVPLNIAPSDLAYRIIRDGKLLFCRDEAHRQVFEAGVLMRFLGDSAE